MTTDYRALLLELVEAWESYSYADAGDATDRMSEAVKEARAALAQPEPVGVTDEEAQELFNAIRVEILGTHFDKDVVLGYEPVRPGVFARAVLARWGRPITELEDGEIDEEAATVIPWLLEEAAQAADADQPYAAGKLTLAAQLLCERRALAQPEPVGAEPTRRQIMQLADELGLSDLSGSLQLVQEAFRRWGRPALSQPEAVGPTDEELLATQDQAVALFPPVHPEAEPLSAVEYARELEIRKARAVLQRWGRPTIEPKATKEDVLDWLRQDRAWGTVIAPTMWRRPEDDELLDLLQRAIARFGRPAVESEPAGERLPVFEEVDAEHFG